MFRVFLIVWEMMLDGFDGIILICNYSVTDSETDDDVSSTTVASNEGINNETLMYMRISILWYTVNVDL